MATTTKRGLNKPDRTSLVNVITAINNNMDNLDDAVPDSRKVNGKALSSDVTIDGADMPILNTAIANTQAMIAPPFVEATPNEAGTFVTNAGALYYLPNGHTANTTWANTSKTVVKAGSELTKLKSAIDSKDGSDTDVFTGGNVIDFEAITTGYRLSTSTGNPVSNASYFVTDFIPIRPGMIFRINHTFDSASYGTAFYDASKTFISGSGKGGTTYNMVAPAGAAYVRTTFKTSVQSDAKAEISYPKMDDLADTAEKADRVYKSVPMVLQQGGLSTETGGPTTNTKYVRTRDFYEVTETPIFLRVRPGYKIGWRIYSAASTDSFLSYSSLSEEDFFIPAKVGQYIKFAIGLVSGNDLSPAECQGYNPLCILTLDDTLKGKFSIPATEAVNYGFHSVCGFIEEATGIKNYIWEVGYIPTTTLTVDKDDVRYHSSWRHLVIPCEAGDSFFIYAINCSSGARPYSFIDSSGNVLSQRNKNSAKNITITAPADTAYLVCNSGPSETLGWTCKLHTLSSDISSEDDADILNKIQQLARPRRVTRVLQTPPLVLLHFSDIHADVVNLGRIAAFAWKFSNYINDVIHTGDNVDYEYSDGFTSWWDSVEGSENILNVIGNHDSNVKVDGNPSWYAISEADDYATFIAPYIAGWGATYTADHCYYYKDYTANNVRLICLDAMHLTDAQLEWFTATLASAKTAGLHVLIACHMRGHFPETPIASNFNDKFLTDNASPSFSPTYKEYLPTAWSDAVQDFIDGGGNFVAWIGGHTHYDVFTKLDRHPDQVQILVGMAGIVYSQTSAMARVLNTKSQDLFNVLAVDTYSKTIKVIRVGADYNLMMQHKDTMCWNYDTGTLIV